MGLAPVSRQNWQPATLADRGVAVPFTTPRLAGARARRAERGVDLIVPNPSGARGVYILLAASLQEYCVPTLHDMRLAECVAQLPSISPRAMRRAARRVAAEGLAGRAAREAALRAEQLAGSARILMNEAVVRRLVVGDRSSPVAASAARDRVFDQRARSSILLLAQSLGRSADAVTDDLETLAGLYIDIGIDSSQDGERCPALIETIRAAADSIEAWSQAAPAHSPVAGRLAAAARDIVPAARQALAEARARTCDLPGLLGDIACRGESLALDIQRVDWLLDGWDIFCLLWRLAEDDAARAAALADMAATLPVLPLEVAGGAGGRPPDIDRPHAASAEPGRQWSPSRALDLVARNERMRGLLAA